MLLDDRGMPNTFWSHVSRASFGRLPRAPELYLVESLDLVRLLTMIDPTAWFGGHLLSLEAMTAARADFAEVLTSLAESDP